MLELVTFTGIDQYTSLTSVGEIAAQYPKAEFGVLVGSQTGGNNPIFPPVGVVRFARQMLPRHQIAIHLCGKYARQAAGIEEPTQELYDLCGGFGRVQVNLHGDIDDTSRIDPVLDSLRWFADRPYIGGVILQHRATWEEIPLDHPKVEYLFDLSEGGGVESFDLWPEPPHSGKRVGYAGGIGPQTIHKALTFEANYADDPMWFDMEGRIRTGGYFDLSKIRAVCESAFS